MTPTDRERLREGALSLGAPLGDAALDRFARYLEMLREWNARFNLTRVPWEEAVPRHFLESIAVSLAFQPVRSQRALDLGSGAGFPGVPLAIAFPSLEMTLLDATRKRVQFLEAAICSLGLERTRAIHARAEDLYRHPEHRAAYDLLVSRAVAPCERLARWSLPFLKAGGIAVAMKSLSAREEIEASRPLAESLGGTLESVREVEVPYLEARRLLAIYRKSSPPSLASPRPNTRWKPVRRARTARSHER